MEAFRGMACPFFMPVERFEGGAWLHPSQLPLGDGWRGHCTAAPTDAPAPNDQHLQDYCNLGYATLCPHLPAQRASDAVRFSVARYSDHQVVLRFVCEMNYLPAGHGTLEFLKVEQRWTQPHPDPRIQKMAECYLESYLRRTDSVNPAIASAVALVSEPS
jgi:hypothetical protein